MFHPEIVLDTFEKPWYPLDLRSEKALVLGTRIWKCINLQGDFTFCRNITKPVTKVTLKTLILNHKFRRACRVCSKKLHENIDLWQGIILHSYSITSHPGSWSQSSITKLFGPLSLVSCSLTYLLNADIQARVRVWQQSITTQECVFNVRVFLDTSHSFVKLPRCRDPSPPELLRRANIPIFILLLTCLQCDHRFLHYQHRSVTSIEITWWQA